MTPRALLDARFRTALTAMATAPVRARDLMGLCYKGQPAKCDGPARQLFRALAGRGFVRALPDVASGTFRDGGGTRFAITDGGRTFLEPFAEMLGAVERSGLTAPEMFSSSSPL